MKILTLSWRKNGIETVELYKDFGGIPYALSKYLGYQSNLINFGKKKTNINDLEYLKYVDIKQFIVKNRYISLFWHIIKYINEYDIINIYYVGIMGILITFVAKLFNPNIVVWVKLDLGRAFFENQVKNKTLKRKIKNFLLAFLTKKIDLYTVETKTYEEPLNNLKRFNGKVKYLPNGFFSDLVKIDKDIKKEKIILTVGRLGTLEKNTEMLVEAIENIETEKLKNWKIYLVGSMTDEFTKWFNERLNVKPYLKNYFIVTGNISDKKELYTLYAKSSAFVLPSRWESWGLALTEAMAFGCFPIVTDCCDAFYEILDIANSNFGKIIPTEDKNALINAIEEVLDNKVDYINNGIKAHEFVSENFDWEIIAQKLDNYFREIYETRLCTKKY